MQHSGTSEAAAAPPRSTAAWHRPSPHRLACRAAAVTWTVSQRYPLRTRPAPSPCVHVGPVFSPTREQNSRRSHFCLVTVEVGHRTPAGRHSSIRRQLRLTAPTPPTRACMPDLNVHARCPHVRREVYKVPPSGPRAWTRPNWQISPRMPVPYAAYSAYCQ